jgi:5-methylcytosine-specific restriction endonuclease McrA
VDVASTLKSCEDFLFPAMKMTVRERSLYYYLFRHTRLIGKENGLFAIHPLATTLALGASTVRDDIRSLHERGCIRIEECSRTGHLIRVLLPEEIDGVFPRQGPAEVVDIETVDFSTDRLQLTALLSRENGACFYCLRLVRPDNCELDHVVARAGGTNHSYRNVVVSCHECNTTKQAREAADFVRSLYRRRVLSQSELEGHLSALEQLQAGRLVPEIGQPTGANQPLQQTGPA